MPQGAEPHTEEYISPPDYSEPNPAVKQNDPLEPRYAAPMESSDYEDSFVESEANRKPNESPAFDNGRKSSLEGEQVVVNQTAVVGFNPSKAEIFHYISLICCCLSLAITPLIELVPMVIFCVMKNDLYAQTIEKDGLLHKIDLVVTIVATLIVFIILLFLAVFSFGIYAIFMVLLIPYLVVIGELIASRPKVDKNVPEATI